MYPGRPVKQPGLPGIDGPEQEPRISTKSEVDNVSSYGGEARACKGPTVFSSARIALGRLRTTASRTCRKGCDPFQKMPLNGISSTREDYGYKNDEITFCFSELESRAVDAILKASGGLTLLVLCRGGPIQEVRYGP